MTRYRIRLTFPRGLPRVKVTGTWASRDAAEKQVAGLYPTHTGMAVINLDRTS